MQHYDASDHQPRSHEEVMISFFLDPAVRRLIHKTGSVRFVTSQNASNGTSGVYLLSNDSVALELDLHVHGLLCIVPRDRRLPWARQAIT